MNANRENFKALALELLGNPQAHLSAKERQDLWKIATGIQPITAAQGATVNRISERLRVTA